VPIPALLRFRWAPSRPGRRSGRAARRTWAAGRAIRARRLLIEELTRTTTAPRLSREAHARDAGDPERSRVAGGLHDVIAHSVGVMVVQAGAAERMVPLDPDRAVAAA
jgi:signal transduction histidine kinase